MERCREQVRQRDDDGVRVTLLTLHVQEALGAGAARLVDDDDRPRRELVLLGDAVDEPGHLVGAAAGAGGNDELDGLGGLPRGGGSRQERSGQEHEEENARRDLRSEERRGGEEWRSRWWPYH